MRRHSEAEDSAILQALRELLADAFRGPLEFAPAMGEGTHRTYLLKYEGNTCFVRVEDGPEGDGHLDTESRVMAAVARAGVRVPRVFFTDATRAKAPFAVQVIEFFDCPDLNRSHRQQQWSLCQFSENIGRAVACWQTVPVQGFGPFQDDFGGNLNEKLTGYHADYATYYHLHLERHLKFLGAQGFLHGGEVQNIRALVSEHAGLLELSEPCLVHKDLALWNILGTAQGIRAYIDWDDAIGGDPTDDLSLLACFHPAEVVLAAIRGYQSERSLPDRFASRFWLHLLRNMIVKAVIRCGAGYFEQTSANFLMGSGQNGADLKAFTRERLFVAYRGLSENLPITNL